MPTRTRGGQYAADRTPWRVTIAPMSWYSPLFQQAGRAILDAAKAEFAASTAGRLFRETEREFRRPAADIDRLGKTLRRYSGYGVRDALQDLRGTQFGQFAREVERYARGDMRTLLNQFLGELGPAGTLIKALTGAQGRGEVDKLVSILQAFGYEVLPPPHARKRGEAVTDRGIAAAQELLESMGARVTWPDRESEPWEAPRRLPFGIPIQDERGRARENVTLPMADGPAQRFGLQHPIVTGEMVPAKSSNVHSFGYDIESTYLYVRYLGYIRGAKGPDGGVLRAGPGSLYRYRDVTPEEFLTLYAANSKGHWVWDHLRIRGTWSGHQKDYELVGVEGGYVPRKATVRKNPLTGDIEEWFVQRRVRGLDGRWMTSALGSEPAGPVPWGEIDRGRPDRGTPDRGQPDRGTPW